MHQDHKFVRRLKTLTSRHKFIMSRSNWCSYGCRRGTRWLHDLEKEFKEAEIFVDVVDTNCLVTGGRKFKILTIFLSVDVFVLEKLAQSVFLADNFGRILLSVGFIFTIGGQKDSLLWNFGTLDPSGVKEITSDFLEDMLEDVSTDLCFIFFGLEKANGT